MGHGQGGQGGQHGGPGGVSHSQGGQGGQGGQHGGPGGHGQGGQGGQHGGPGGVSHSQGGQHGGPGGGGHGGRGGPGDHGQSWRQGHSSWQSHGIWQRDRNWWRHDRRFGGYNGLRIGFFFAPGWGYYEVPRQYYGYRWAVGQYLPQAFWQYQVSDYWNYGLPEPPYGCAWIWLNGSIALVNLSDGYIIDMVYNVW
jgi:Ni/Co efflux regulator RcnB